MGPRAALSLVVTFASGQRQVVQSNATAFAARQGPVTQDSVYHGEEFDMRKHDPDWSLAGRGRGFYLAAEAMPAPGGDFFLQTQPPVRLLQCAPPQSARETLLNVRVLDFGLNAAGVLRLRATGPRGTTVIARHAEYMDWTAPGPFIAVDNLRAAAATDRFILSGGSDVFLPRFTVHGFRYVELRNLPHGAVVERCLVSSAPAAWAPFAAASPVLEAIYAATGNALRSNWLGVLSDTPARDERKQWQGDAALTVLPALLMFDGLEPLYLQMLAVIRDSQLRNGAGMILSDTAPLSFGSAVGDPAWGMAYPQILFALASYSGAASRAALAEHFPHALAWIGFLQSQVAARGIGQLYYNYGDWVPPPPAEKVSGHMTSAFAFIRQLQTMEYVAVFLNLTQEAETLRAQTVKAQQGFHEAFFIPGCGCYHETEQAGDVFALASGSVPSQLVAGVGAHLLGLIARDGGHFSCGIVSMAQLFFVLHDTLQRPDVALQILTRSDYPSYGFTFSNPYDNATNLHEIWNFFAEDGGMNSYSHHMYGSVAQYLLTRVAGLEPDRHGAGVTVRIPHLSGRELSSCRASLRGHSVAWQIRDGRVSVKVTVATRATLHIPTLPPQYVEPGSYEFVDLPAAEEQPPLPIQSDNRFAAYYKQAAK